MDIFHPRNSNSLRLSSLVIIILILSLVIIILLLSLVIIILILSLVIIILLGKKKDINEMKNCISCKEELLKQSFI